MFAIIAAILFGIALILNLLSIGEFQEAFIIAGLLGLALQMAVGTGIPWRKG
jgi:hypothetical protein